MEEIPNQEAVLFWKNFAEGQSEEKTTDLMEEILRSQVRAFPKAADLSSHQGITWIKVLTAIIQTSKRAKIDMFDLLFRYAYVDGLPDEGYVGEQHVLMATGMFSDSTLMRDHTMLMKLDGLIGSRGQDYGTGGHPILGLRFRFVGKAIRDTM